MNPKITTQVNKLPKFITTRDVNLAAALASDSKVDLLPLEQEPIQRFSQDGEEFYVFRFVDSPRAKEIMREWADKDSIQKYPDSVVSYHKAFVHNRNRFLEYVKETPKRTIVKNGNRIYFISDKDIEKYKQERLP